MFCRSAIRAHADLDIGILRCDAPAALPQLSTWQIFEAKAGELTRLEPGRVPRSNVHTLWGRQGEHDPWAIELVLDEGDRDVWIYRREPSIRRPLTEVVKRTPHGLPYLAPEVQLLYKSSAPRDRDEADFRQTWPLLDLAARVWLAAAIEAVNPRHPWLRVLARP